MSEARRVAVVGYQQVSNRLLVAAWRARGVPCDLLEPAQALERLRPGDVALVRLDVLPTLDGVEPGLGEVGELEDRGVCVLNRRGPLVAAHDKLRTAAVLDAAGLPAPRTAHVTRAGAESPLPPPVVVKPRFGSWGADVLRCESERAFADALREVRDRPWFVKDGALVQELLPPAGHDLRLIVAAGRVVGAVERVAREGEWRTNTALGATRRAAVPGQRARELGVRAAAAVGMDFVGVDLLPVGDGHVVLELNGAVEFDDSYDIADASVYDAAASALELPRRIEPAAASAVLAAAGPRERIRSLRTTSQEASPPGSARAPGA